MKTNFIVIMAILGVVLMSGCIEEKVSDPSTACLDSGGTVRLNLCCKSVTDFPDTCLIGACGCSPDNSHEVKICDCGEGKCWSDGTCIDRTPPITPEPITDDTEVYCVKDGELLKESDEYCCEGLKEWSIPDTRLSIADICYEVGEPSKILARMCIECGDGVCGKHLMYDENPCNCPEDCKGKSKSQFQSIEEFCQSNDWKISLSKMCEETIEDSPICKLC